MILQRHVIIQKIQHHFTRPYLIMLGSVFVLSSSLTACTTTAANQRYGSPIPVKVVLHDAAVKRSESSS